MRSFVLGAAASTLLGCSDGASHREPPETFIDDKPAALTNQAHVRITFHPGGIANRFTCQLDSGDPTTCLSPFEADVADGDHTFAVAAALNAVVDDTPAAATWTVDTVAPETAIVAAPPPLDNALMPEVTFNGSDNRGAVTFECALDDGAFSACTSPATVPVTDGNHTYRVRAVDAAGNRDPSPATASWTVDASAPETLISAGPAAGSFTADDVTFSFGSPDSPVSFECALDGAAFAACTSPVALTLPDGSHTFAVRAKDPAGAIDPSPATRTWTVDTVPPVVTVTDVATPTRDSTPSVSFTVTGGATSIQCRVDTGAFVDCASPFTPAALVDGAHTVTVRATDAAGNPGSDATTFTVDGTPPGLAFDDTPPAQWPVNYFDMQFHTTDATATLTCSLDGAAFTACASPLAIATAYGAASTFSVRARDPAGNTTAISTSWTSTAGLVLHYPWEQGQTHNTSLLAQRTPYSPDGTATLPAVGGWAGTAAGSPGAHAYKGTIRALSSSPDGAYTASLWVRMGSSTDGTLLSTLTASNGFQLAVGIRGQVSLRVNEGGKAFTVNTAIPQNEWVQLGVLTNGPTTGLELLVNGASVGTAQAPTVTGFGSGQADDLIVGAVAGVDLDDLRFYNRAIEGSERCTTLVRGQLDAAGACVPLTPGFELDFENNVVRDTGHWNLGFVSPSPALISFVPTTLGNGLKLATSQEPFSITQGFAAQMNAAPGHSFSFWFVAGAGDPDTMVDFLHVCAAGAPLQCGIRVTSTASGLTVAAAASSTSLISKSIAVASGPHSVVVTEQKADASGTTQSLTVYVDGNATVMPIGTGNVYANPSDTVQLPHVAGTTVDEIEFWPRDLSKDAEMLCENGWDGEWNPATASCLLTSN